MAIVCKPPKAVHWDEKVSVFLAGTIDLGNSDDWQVMVSDALQPHDVKILNPRRDAWDNSWQQSIGNPQFRQQVEWELEGLEKASIIFMYFAAESRSPISLLELGLHAAGNKLIVVCPEGFWRKGNIEVVANRYQIPLFTSLAAGIAALQQKIEAM